MDDLARNFDVSATRWGIFVVLMVLSGVGSCVYGLTFFDTLIFFIGVFLLFHIPDSILIRSVGFQAINGLTYLVLALGAVTVVIPVFYKFFRYLSVWVSFVTEAQGKFERAKSILLFFDKGTDTSERLDVLNKYQVDYVYGPTSELFFMEDLPGAELALHSGDLVLYRVFGH